jgi:hypothetical protein
MAPLSEWLQLMLAEITRKRDEEEHARAEGRLRAREGTVVPPGEAAQHAAGATGTPPRRLPR